MIASLDNSGALGLFSGLNLLALVLVFLLVEETKRRSLEDLDLVFAVPKRTFARFQVKTYLPWFVRHYFGWLLCFWKGEKHRSGRDKDGGVGVVDIKPNLYIDTIWGPNVAELGAPMCMDAVVSSPYAPPPPTAPPVAHPAAGLSMAAQVPGDMLAYPRYHAYPSGSGGPLDRSVTHADDDGDRASSIHD